MKGVGVRLGDHALAEQDLPEELQRIARQPVLDLRLAAVGARIGTGMAALAIGLAFDESGSAAAAGPLDGLGQRVVA